jgi:Helicase associated domain
VCCIFGPLSSRPHQIRERSADASPLTADQIAVLESVRFAFTTRGEEHWQKSYEKLKEFKEEHGHVLVPRQSEIPGLGDWVSVCIHASERNLYLWRFAASLDADSSRDCSGKSHVRRTF